MKKLRILSVVLFFLSLSIFLTLLHFFAPISLTSHIVEIILNSSLSLSGILIAVIGILLGIYISQSLKNTEHGEDFQILLSILTFSVFISFTTSILALYSLANPDCKTISTIILHMFFSIIYMNAITVAATVIKILYA